MSAILLAGLAAGFSCSIFSPDTNVGGDVVKTVDSTVTNLKIGFSKIDSIFLAVKGARSVVLPGADTSFYRLPSGVHPTQMVAGRIGNDSVVAYAEFHVNSAVINAVRAGCSLSVDSVYMQLTYYQSVNDTTRKDFPDSLVHVSVHSCQRKFFPGVSNALTAQDNPFTSTLTFSRRHADTTFSIPLGPEVVAALKAAVADTNRFVRDTASLDTSVGWLAIDSTRKVKPDTAYPDTNFVKDSVLQFFSDTLLNAGVANLQSFMQGDTAIISYSFGPTSVSDTVPFARSINRVFDTVPAPGISTIVNYSVWREITIAQRFLYDSNSINYYNFYVSSFHVYASAGSGIIRFLAPPNFLIRYRGPSCDTNAANWVSLGSGNLHYYCDMTVTEVPPLPPDSLVASWQSDRFVEIPVDLTPIWKFAQGGGNGLKYSIVQDARFFLNCDSLHDMERPGADTTQRKIVYGLFDHRITNARAQSNAAYDSVAALTGCRAPAHRQPHPVANAAIFAGYHFSSDHVPRASDADHRISLCFCKVGQRFCPGRYP